MGRQSVPWGSLTVDPCLNLQGKNNNHLYHLLQKYKKYKKDKKDNLDPNWVKYLPIQVICHSMSMAVSFKSVSTKGIMDMVALVFFYLLQPGE